MRNFATDAQRAMLSMLFGAVLPFVVLGLVIVGLFLSCRKIGEMDLEIGYASDTVRITDSVIVTRTDTVVKYQRRVDTVRAVSDSLDAAVVIQNDSTVVVQDTLQVELPPVIVADLRALRVTVVTQDSLIRALYAKDTTWQWRFDAHQKVHKLELQKANAPRWGVGATIGYGCLATQCGPVLSVGLSYQAKLPSLKQLVVKAVR